ncbi:hypothetical protein T484DRAFT_1798979 [Baffinella frigidus]|nr:hypothetical protein T484DRAFT_1798979 [Cryptophyta sp. CCMP2293]
MPGGVLHWRMMSSVAALFLFPWVGGLGNELSVIELASTQLAMRLRGGGLGFGSWGSCGAEPLACTVEDDEVWGKGRLKKWKGAAGSAEELLAALRKEFDVDAKRPVQLQYHDEEVACFVDLDERAWPDFLAQKRRSVRLAEAVPVCGPPGGKGGGAGAGRGGGLEGELDGGAGGGETENEDEDEDEAVVTRVRAGGGGGRRRGGAEVESEEEEEDEDEDEEYVGDGVKQMGKKGAALGVEAFVLDVSPLDGDPRTSTDGPDADKGDASWGVKQRIRKMLELGLHKETGESEAKQAITNAMRLLTKHNLEKADVLDGKVRDTGAVQGGLKVVELSGKRSASLVAWMRELGNVAAKAFDVSYYTVQGRGSPTQVVFYGVAANAACAAYAFAAACNRILSLSSAFPVPRASFFDHRDRGATGCTTLGAFSRICRASYRVGLVQGLSEGGLSRDAKVDPGDYQEEAGEGGDGGKAKADQQQEWRQRASLSARA